MGAFEIVPNTLQNNLPVYQNSNQQLLYFVPSWGNEGAWLIYDNYNEELAAIRGYTSPACPDKYEILWEYIDEEWKSGDITVEEKSKF